ncbi:MAG TPA: signal recognition particle protein [Myxococcales bacterium]|nr:signal recognition particle protein [Myxococcales bacterium]
MLETIAKGFKSARNRLRGQVELTPQNIEEALRDVRVALLEADVDLTVTRRFIARVQEKALGEIVALSAQDARGRKIVTQPGDHFIKICHDELEALMGPVDTTLKWSKQRPTGVMVVGLQGSGKTTTAAKLAAYLAKSEGKRPMLVAADVYRPAAIDQLRVLGEKLGFPVWNEPGVAPPDMCKHALSEAVKTKRDLVIFDTAGRLAIDEQMMTELEQVKAAVQPDDILLVCDAMIGQDAVRTAAEFDRRLALDGFILTKLDGDARGGAALSIKEITGKPIKFVGMGEGLDKLEEFRPEGLASRILGFGDIVGLMKDFEGVVDEDKAEEDAKKILSGEFHLGDFVEQIKLVKKMGPLSEVMERFPIFGDMPEGFSFDDKALDRIEAMVASMTEQERNDPDVLTPARVKRIARGSGRTEQDVNGLVAQYRQMRQVMRQIGSAPGLLARLPGFRQIAQLRKLQGKGLDDLFGDDAAAVEAAMGGGMDPKAMARAAGMPSGMTPRIPAGAMAKARMMGYLPPGKPVNAVDRDRLREKRKRERQNRKKNRKKRR